jgi:cytochrome c oxidase subunit 2
MAVAAGILVLVILTLVFHFFSPWWFTPLAADWATIDLTVDITFWVTGLVFVVLNGFLVWVVVRYRHRQGNKAEYDPENKKLEWWLTIVTSVGVIAMLAPGLLVWARIVEVPEDAAVVEVVGQQWHWSFRFPGEDGVLGQVDVALMTAENPFGMKPDDPAGQDDVLIDNPELHLAINQPYKLVFRSKDVLHNFTVPQFRVKMDLVPGMAPYVWLEPTRAGRFDIMCEELCGIAHFAMRGAVVVEERDAFDEWVQRHPTYSEVSSRPAPDIVAGAASYQVCAACHGAAGEGNMVLNAPRLAGLQDWYLHRQLRNFKNGLRGASPDDVFGMQMAPMAATLADDDAIRNIVAFIDSLPEPAPKPTLVGDAERGKEIYTTCQSCHGLDGQGIWSQKAPRLSGVDDWYLVRQLEHYRQGIRGSHPEDLYGKQMALISIMLRDDEALSDLAAYINTL